MKKECFGCLHLKKEEKARIADEYLRAIATEILENCGETE